MTTSPVLSITDELLVELQQKAKAATPQRLDSAEHVIAADPGAMIECPICHGEGYASLENDYCNFDGHALGVQFYGIGPEFGAAEEYFRAATPATILALVEHIRSLTERMEMANKALRSAVAVGRRSIGDHYAPNDCYATGPLTGSAYHDLLECPACAALAEYDLIDAAIALEGADHE